ncbi:MAG: protein kinase [Labilithrix sp.]|nr:protein kinase [Labilithrix sp.]
MATQLQDPFGLVGTTLDNQYRVDAVIGEGGFGVVYKGWHFSLEQPVAIKALKVLSADDRRVQDALFAKFKDEAKILYTLSSQSLHIVRSIDFGAATTPSGHWAPFMVLEWLDGCSLAEDLALRRRARMQGRTLDEALAILEPAAQGLSVAHQRKVAHRDVKPANFFLVPDGDGLRVKVLDFGIAKIIRDGEAAGTQSPFASFTWLYAAPEQLDPRIGVTGLPTDVYALALVFTELLTDRPPVEGRDVVTLLKAATDPTVRPTPRQRGANVPDAIEVACRRALTVDPKGRYASVADFWQALATARQAPRVTHHPPSAVSSMSMTVNPETKPSPHAPPGVGISRAGSGAPAAPSGHAQPLPPMGPSLATGPGGHAAPLAPHPAQPIHAIHPMSAQAAAMSPPRMTPPPGGAVPHTMRVVRQPTPSPGPSVGMVITILAIVLGAMFMGTCALLHAAC